MKQFCLIFVIFLLFVLVSCGNSSKNDNNDKPDSGETVTEEDTDSTEPSGDTGFEENDGDKTDTGTVEDSDTMPDSGDSSDDYDTTDSSNDSNNSQDDSDADQGRKQGELYGECYPNETCNQGLICDIENNICIKDTSNTGEDSDSDVSDSTSDDDSINDADLSDSGDDENVTDSDNDSSDSIPDNDADTELPNPCEPNPCLNITNSPEICIVFGNTYRCECNQDYYWNGNNCGTVQTQTVACVGLPNNAEWNSVSEIIQEWDDYLGTWIPLNEGSYNEDPSTNQCRFKCEENYVWSNNSACLYNMDNDPLMWSSFQEKSTVFNETSACSTVTDGGFNDWRLPTIGELRTLIQNCDSTKTGGTCGVNNECLSWDECRDESCNGCDQDLNGKYSKLGDNKWLYSISEQPDNEHNYVVDFSKGQITDINNVISAINIKFYYRCVRNAE